MDHIEDNPKRDMQKKLLHDYPDILNADIMCEILQVSKKTVYKLIKDGKLRSFKVGREYRVTKTTLIEYCEEKNLYNKVS